MTRLHQQKSLGLEVSYKLQATSLRCVLEIIYIVVE